MLCLADDDYLRWSRGHKARGQGHKKNPRPRTALPRTDPLEAKDRNARDQGSRTQAQVFSEKKKRSSKKCFRRSPVKTPSKIYFSGDLRNFNNSKKLLSSSRGQGSFRKLEASKPRPRTSKCDLKDVLEAKDVLKDSTSDDYAFNAKSLCPSRQTDVCFPIRMRLDYCLFLHLNAVLTVESSGMEGVWL